MKVQHLILTGAFAAALLGTPGLAKAQSEVADAAMSRDVNAVRALVEDAADVNARQADGATALHWAVYHNEPEMVRVLIDAGADVSVANRNGSTPLWLASTTGNATMIDILVDAGADPNEPLPLGRTPLMLAARSGNVEAVRVLVESGADLNARETARGTTPLMWAADQGHADVATFLIENGASVEARSAPAGRNARNNIGKDNDPRESVRDQVIRILEAQAEGELGERPASGLPGQLEREETDDQAETAETEETADIAETEETAATVETEDAEDQAEGEQPASTGDPAADAIAETAEATPAGDPVADAAGENDTDDAVAEAQPGDADFQGFDRQTDRGDEDGGRMTSLVYAARSNAMDVARILIENGADVNQVTGYGWSPLLVATQNRNYQMGAFLIENGADVNIANAGGWTPLYLATDNRNIEDGDYPVRDPDMDDLEYIRLLLESGADTNARMTDSTETRTVFTNQWLDEEGATAFFRASQSGDVDLMRMLLEYGADPLINTTLNVTPLQVAAGIGWVEGVTSERSTEETVEAVRLLLDLGVDPNIQAETGRTALHGAAHKGATEVVEMLVEAGARMDVRDFGNTDNRGSPELAAHTWLPIDYADGLVRVGVQSAISHPETSNVLRELMLQAGIEPPPAGRTLDSICIVEVCNLFPETIFGEDFDPQEVLETGDTGEEE